MTTVIDSLVLEFGLDTSTFTKQQREAIDNLRKFEQEAEKIGGRAEQQTKKTVDMMSALRREVVGVAAAFLGARGVTNFLQNLNSADAAIGRAALTFNMSARELSTWEGAAGQAGAKAGEMKSTIGALTSDMNKFMITGQGALVEVLRPLGVDLFDSNKNLKDAGQIIKEIVSALDDRKLDPARRAAFLQMLPGMTEGSLNLMMKSRKELEEYLRISRDIGSTTADSAEKAAAYERAVSNLDRAFSALGRTITTALAPALAGLANIWTDTLSGGENSLMKIGKGTLLDRLIDISMGRSKETPGDAIVDWWKNGKINAPTTPTPPAPARSAPQSRSEVIDYIRKGAIARGMDPDTAVAVAQSEGLNNYIGDKGTSFGPFQLHYGGIGAGALAASGLGDAFTKKTGLNARDETTWREQIDFSLDHARNSGTGWASWYGARNTGIGQFQGIPRGGSTRTSTVNIGTMNIETRATNAQEFAHDVKPALERAGDSSQFNTSLE